jgi:hypothetical protein
MARKASPYRPRRDSSPWKRLLEIAFTGKQDDKPIVHTSATLRDVVDGIARRSTKRPTISVALVFALAV